MQDIQITGEVSIPYQEIELAAIRSQGAGGQHVNKVASGIHLRFDIRNSSLPDEVKSRLLAIQDHRLTKNGLIVIKSQQARSQEQNRINALTSLQNLIRTALVRQKPRRKTRPTKSSQEKRVTVKKLRGKAKQMRQKVTE
ncbi:alternative ribosome rescue aminoacyl-tRNA hydrolase ArfB [Pelobacter seleniigenes]|uniref:alternative ribosome rescue aminoacyl-tRNA hydrolase ArfB n=1 Tax=Pelobacter seleniigenes TaxID=407188 RepID=UPI0004A6BAB3|nr:alternative ribosome rescue aminoacyl-tRNA hydrolase ArfB [Pelobacter seleniigenes]